MRNIIGKLDIADLVMGIIGLVLSGTGVVAMCTYYAKITTTVQYIVVIILHVLLISTFAIVANSMLQLARRK